MSGGTGVSTSDSVTQSTVARSGYLIVDASVPSEEHHRNITSCTGAWTALFTTSEWWAANISMDLITTNGRLITTDPFTNVAPIICPTEKHTSAHT
eukprot:291615-Pyramimonas_sp.AAC.3